MKKVFLYLYPIKEYIKMSLLPDELYGERHIERPLPILNSTITRRYREKGYQVVFVLYPDKEIYGVESLPSDKVIYTDITFGESSAYDENGNRKKDFVPKYPKEELLLGQLGDVDELIVGGYHVSDCVKKVAEVALENGIDALVDLDLTDLFFDVYRREDYFKEDTYSPERFKNSMLKRHGEEYMEFERRLFERNYSSPSYGYTREPGKAK